MFGKVVFVWVNDAEVTSVNAEVTTGPEASQKSANKDSGNKSGYFVFCVDLFILRCNVQQPPRKCAWFHPFRWQDTADSEG